MKTSGLSYENTLILPSSSHFLRESRHSNLPHFERFLRAHERASERTRTCTSRTQQVCFSAFTFTPNSLSHCGLRVKKTINLTLHRWRKTGGETFTFNPLYINTLPRIGEAVKEKIEKRRTRARTRTRGHRHSQCIACLFFDSISHEELWFIRKWRTRGASDIWSDEVLKRRKAQNLLEWSVRSPASAKVTAPGRFSREELREPLSKVHSYSPKLGLPTQSFSSSSFEMGKQYIYPTTSMTRYGCDNTLVENLASLSSVHKPLR